MLHQVLREDLVQLFKFYLAGAIRTGMRHSNDLYGLIEEFDPRGRLKAYALAQELATDAKSTIVTVSDAGYKVWINLKTSSSAALNPMTERFTA